MVGASFVVWTVIVTVARAIIACAAVGTWLAVPWSV